MNGEDKDHLFVSCDFYGKLLLVSNCIGFSSATHGNLQDHLVQFCGLGGYSKHVRLTFNIIWLLVMLVN